MLVDLTSDRSYLGVLRSDGQALLMNSQKNSCVRGESAVGSGLGGGGGYHGLHF